MFDKINLYLLEQLEDLLTCYSFELTSHYFDLQYHADLKVTNSNGNGNDNNNDNNIEYWLMRFRRLPYRDFTLRTKSKWFPSEFEKIYNGNTISNRYLHLVVDNKYQVKEVFVINIKRLSKMKQFLQYVYKYQNKRDFVYITPNQLFENGLLDYYIKL